MATVDDTSGKLIAFAMDVSYTLTTDYKEIRTIDNSLPEDMAPAQIEVEVVCHTIKIPKESPIINGFAPSIFTHLDQAYIRIELRDKITGAYILLIPRALMTKRSGVIKARGIGSETWTFRGMAYQDELTLPQKPNRATK
jgi:hypothetical protein